MDSKDNNFDLFADIKSKMDLKDIDASLYSPLSLAYIGDCVYELIVRSMLVAQSNRATDKLHREALNYVKANAQANMYYAVEGYLTPEELAVYKRGRNAKPATRAKNATMTDYRVATGFEALLGWLYLSENSDRMMELVKIGMSKLDSDLEN